MAGTDREKRMIADGPAIVLVEPQLGENVGMVARAMANFGLADLRLVNPRESFPNDKARAAASKADHVIDAARLFPDLPAAIGDLNFVVATTARPRDGFKAVLGPEAAATGLRARFAAGECVGILFGRERFGLSNEEISLADEIVTFPVNPAFASLNIAQAVLLMSYEWLKSGAELAPPRDIPTPAPREMLRGLMEHLEEALDERGYFRPPARKYRMVENLRTVLMRPGFTIAELKLLRGVVASLDYYSPKVPRGAGYPERKALVDGRSPRGKGSGEE